MLPRRESKCNFPENSGGLRIVNGAAPVKLNSSIGLQRRTNDGWESVPVANFLLRANCTGSTPSCVSLDPGAVLEPPAWTGRSCNSQCPTPCDLDGPLPPGRTAFCSPVATGSSPSRPRRSRRNDHFGDGATLAERSSQSLLSPSHASSRRPPLDARRLR